MRSRSGWQTRRSSSPSWSRIRGSRSRRCSRRGTPNATRRRSNLGHANQVQLDRALAPSQEVEELIERVAAIRADEGAYGDGLGVRLEERHVDALRALGVLLECEPAEDSWRSAYRLCTIRSRWSTRWGSPSKPRRSAGRASAARPRRQRARPPRPRASTRPSSTRRSSRRRAARRAQSARPSKRWRDSTTRSSATGSSSGAGARSRPSARPSAPGRSLAWWSRRPRRSARPCG